MLKKLKSFLKKYPTLVKANRALQNKFNNMRDVYDSLSIKTSRSEMTQYGFKFLGSTSIHHRAMQKGEFEPEETSLIQQHLEQAQVFVDIGANIGFFSCIARSLNKNVVAIEPLAQNLKFLYGNLLENGWEDIEVFPIGLSHKPGLVTLHGASSTGASMIENWAGASKQFRRTIPTSTLDIVLGDRFIGKKLFIKIDVEGVECSVLKGARKTLETLPHPTWMIEICLNEFHPEGINPYYLSTFEIFWERGYEVRTANGASKLLTPADVNRWVKEKRCDSGVINYLFLPQK